MSKSGSQPRESQSFASRINQSYNSLSTDLRSHAHFNISDQEDNLSKLSPSASYSNSRTLNISPSRLEDSPLAIPDKKPLTLDVLQPQAPVRPSIINGKWTNKIADESTLKLSTACSPSAKMKFCTIL